MKTLELKLKVVASAIDALGHVNNIHYIKWMLMAAESHWNTLSSPAMNKDFLWVVVKHEAHYKAPLFLNDEILIKTYVKESYITSSKRIVEIFKDGKLVFEGSTIWCLISKSSMKPARIPEGISTLFN